MRVPSKVFIARFSFLQGFIFVCVLFCIGERGYFLLLDKVEIRSVRFYAGGSTNVRKLVRNLHQTYAIDYHLR